MIMMDDHLAKNTFLTSLSVNLYWPFILGLWPTEQQSVIQGRP